MKLEKLYDTIAETYNQKASADVLSAANNTAFSLIAQHVKQPTSILGLGVGDGVCLLPYQEQYPEAELYGLDVSENMLKKAQELLNCEVFHGDISQTSALVTNNKFDLILAHFVSAYVPVSTTLQECKKTLRESGLVSLVTNTSASFSKMQNVLAKLGKSSNPFNKLVSFHVKKALKTIYVPRDTAHLQQLFEDNGFKLHELKTLDIPVNLKTEMDVFDFFVNGGWFASGLVHPLLPKCFFHKIVKRLIHEHVSLPYKDTLQVVIAIGSK
jgi:ubiquinone/menaquinone biosynthesis C-methylase UbiE